MPVKKHDSNGHKTIKSKNAATIAVDAATIAIDSDTAAAPDHVVTTSRADKQFADDIVFTKGAPAPGAPQTIAAELEKAARLEATHHGMTLPKKENARVGSPGCQRCEVLPLPMRGPGTLVLRLPHTYTLGKILRFLVNSNYAHSEENGNVKISAPAGSLAPLLTPILNLMSPIEQRDTRAVFQANESIVSESAFWEIEALPDFVNKASSEWLLDILREQVLYSAFQPIVRTAKANGGAHEIFGYECLMRAESDGETVSPVAMLDAAREAKLLFQLDLAARRAAVTGAAQHNIKEKVFINFTPNSIYNPYSCLASTVKMIDELGFERDQIVFEIIESERLPELDHLKTIVKYCRERGFGVALDDVGAGFSSLSMLLELRPDFVKLDMSLVRGVHRDTAKSLVTRKLLETVQELGMQTVAEGVETIEELEWVEEHNVDYVQGYYFARPATPPPEVLQAH